MGLGTDPCPRCGDEVQAYDIESHGMCCECAQAELDKLRTIGPVDNTELHTSMVAALVAFAKAIENATSFDAHQLLMFAMRETRPSETE